MSEAKAKPKYSFFEGLNEKQLEAVTTTEGYIRVIAGAGSGKTRALATRFAYLTTVLGVSPRNILCITFTNKAAQEMRERIKLITQSDDTGIVSTFHGFCAQIIREDYRVVNFPRNFTIIDEDERKLIMKKVMDELKIDSEQLTVKKLLHYVDLRKNGSPEQSVFLLTYEDTTKLRDAFFAVKPENSSCYEEYLEERAYIRFLFYQRRNFGLDFNDLLNIAFHILETNIDCKEKWQHRLQYVMVDEFQDVGPNQYDFVKVLTNYHHNLFVVGDPDQTIYSWRGAKVRYIIDFDREFDNVKTIMMMQNYRSTGKVIAAANTLIKKNRLRIDKDILAVSRKAGAAIYYHAKTRRAEAIWIADEIEMLTKKGVPYQDILILYRMHAVTKQLEEVLMERKIPYRIYSGMPFYSRAEIKDIIAYLRLAVNQDDNLSFERAIQQPPRNIGKRRIEFLQNYSIQNKCSLLEALQINIDEDMFSKTDAREFVATIGRLREMSKDTPISELLTTALNISGYEKMLRTAGEDERLENLAILKQSIISREDEAHEEVTVIDYLNDIALLTNQDKAEKNTEQVSLMTVHTSKGLEAPYVFVYAFNERIFPSALSHDAHSIEEERRLAYVAFTRAKEQLFLSDAEMENNDGDDSQTLLPSRFIFETEHVNLDYVVELPESLIQQAQQRTNGSASFQANANGEIEEFQIGDKVAHSEFGHGTILAINQNEQTYSVKFEGSSTERTIRFNAALTLLETAQAAAAKNTGKGVFVLKLSDDRDSASAVLSTLNAQELLKIYSSARIERSLQCSRSPRYASLRLKLYDIFGETKVEEITIAANTAEIDFGAEKPTASRFAKATEPEPLWGDTKENQPAHQAPISSASAAARGAGSSDLVTKMKEFKELFDLGILTEEEFTEAKRNLLANR